MSDDETMVMVVCACAALLRWGSWYARAFGTATYRVLKPAFPASGASRGARSLLVWTPWICLGVLFVVLRCFASFDVRDSAVYMTFYVCMGAAWVGLVTLLFPYAGISMRDDVLERGNLAAAVALAGGCLGATLSFAGGNIGDGPGWWVVCFAGGLSTCALLLLWFLLEVVAHPSEAVTVDRDLASGIRLGGYLVASGLVLGRAAAGNWVSAAGTLHDFVRIGWPAAVLFAAQVAVERVLRPAGDRAFGGAFASGVLPAAASIGAAAAYVASLGKWS